MRKVDSYTKLLGVVGMPARHSLSPLMQNAGLEKAGINLVYLAFEPKELGKFVRGMKEAECRGFNVTMPFKQEIMKHIDSVDETAKKIGAVNTVVNENGKLKGYNTDGIGCLNALSKVTSVVKKKILLIGAGGAGRAISFYLKKAGAEVFIFDRTSGKAKELSRSIGGKQLDLEELKKADVMQSFDVIINASPSGMKPNEKETPFKAELLSKKQIVFDIVYDPQETLLLKKAKKAGCKTISGIEMLLEQGFESFRLFTGKKAPEKEMRKAVREAMK